MRTEPILVAAALLAACARPPPPEVPTQAQIPLDSSSSAESPSGSGYSTADYGSVKGLSVPRRERQSTPTELVVTPDLYTSAFAVRELGDTPHQALDSVKSAAERLTADVVKRLGSAASVKIKGVAFSRLERKAEPDRFTATADGWIEVRLPAQAGFWDRSRVYVGLVELTQGIAASARSEQNAVRAISFEPPQAAVLAPQARRAELIARWVKEVRQFTDSAQSAAAPLFVQECGPPGSVTQSPLSLDEVRLTLSIDCRIGTEGSHPHTAGGHPSAEE